MVDVHRRRTTTGAALQRCLALLPLVILLCAAGVEGQEDSGDVAPVLIDYFFEPGCSACEEVGQLVLPEMEGRFGGLYELRRHDVGLASNVALLVAYQDALGITENAPVSMIIDNRYAFCGVDAMGDALFERIELAISERLAPGWRPPEPIVVRQGEEEDLVARKVQGFALFAVLAGGLTDGINPCAISTLVFFMSLLAVAKVKGKGLLLMGISFCLASFLTYTALGFGLLRVLHTFSGFPTLRHIVDGVLVLSLAVLAWLSFRDAYRYKTTRDPGEVTLQLPRRVKLKIHDIMRSRLRSGNLVAGGLVIGTAVTALESVCTGQVYVPTMVVVIKSGGPATRAWLYLLLYNTMFVTPLVCAFILTYRGLRAETLLQWSKRNVVTSKMLLGAFFLAMAALILII
ncbi:MAG: hypothetical protein HQ559_02290 [Lentisphaerae bacterium]|nr:hypothetical protein [Lentisphaerota bacterium]